MKYSQLLVTLFVSFATLTVGASAQAKELTERPNIVWIIPDDMSANFSCYGETAIATPNLDALAASGVKFTQAFVTAPVCSTCRSAFITGMYQTTIGAHHHRSGRGALKIELPEEVRPVPVLFQEAGYYTSISGWPIRAGKLGKTDYNFQWDSSMYDGSDWSGRQPGQPFFAQIHTPGGKLRGKDAQGWEAVANAAEQHYGNRTPVDAVTLPPYYPDHPDIRRDWAAYLDSVRMTDAMVGEVLERLDAEGLRESTLVLFMTDHGISHGRGKQFLYDEGIHVPLVIAGPGVEPGSVRKDPVEHIDIAALSLAAAGIKLPESMQAQNILAANYRPRKFVFAARDRCDETVDHLRAVRSQRYKYIRNFLPKRSYLQPNAYKDAKAILKALREYHAAGKLDPIQQLLFRQERPPEELYDLVTDPYEVHNLASNPAYAETLQNMRDRLERWIVETGDQGREPEAMYDSDMEVYTNSPRKRSNPAQLKALLENIQLMKSWDKQGK